MTGPAATRRTTVDLHLHTSATDGDDSPGELAVRCVDAGLSWVCCTDHDTMASVPELRGALAGTGVGLIGGCEITARYDGEEVHCLAYFVDEADDDFQTRLGRVHGAELRWWQEWFTRAGDLTAGAVSWPAVGARFGTGRIPYLGDLLDFFLAAVGDDPRFTGYPRGARHDAFIADWCRPGRPLHVPKPWRPELAEAVEWIRAAGGVAVLAHPARAAGATVDWDALRGLGLAGVEVWTTWHRPEQSRELVEVCRRYGFVPTQGSDYHGARLKPWAPVPGLLPDAAADPDAIVDRLADRRPSGG